MQIVNVPQRSEEWERLRLGIPTASNFHRFITPAKADYSKQADDYACELVAESLGAYMPGPPSFWMEWGVEHEDDAIATYEAINGVEVQRVGFVFPDGTRAFGCSPDGLVGDDGLIECKCTKGERVVRFHLDGDLPHEYKPQIQGELFITGRQWCDFFVYHPNVAPFQLRVDRDEAYIDKLADGLGEFLITLQKIRRKMSGLKPPVEQMLELS